MHLLCGFILRLTAILLVNANEYKNFSAGRSLSVVQITPPFKENKIFENDWIKNSLHETSLIVLEAAKLRQLR